MDFNIYPTNPQGGSSSNNHSVASTDPDNSLEQLEAFLKSRYEFRYNVVTGCVEFRKKNSRSSFKPLQDRDENNIWRLIQKDKRLQSLKISCSQTSLKTIIHSEFSDEFDPFVEYISCLPDWDGKTDHIASLAKTIKTDNDELFHRLLKMWLVGVVGSILPPHAVNQTALVFSGKQGIGKTTWILNLVPQELRTYLFSGTINPANKDTLIYLSSCMIINLDELENLNSSEVGALKELITKPQIKLRRVYARNAEDMPRRASFAGSVNSSQFLNDSSVSRRFLCFEALEIDYQHNINLYLVYAQAFALYKQGYKHYLNMEEIAELEANNSKFQKTTLEEDLLMEMYTPAPEGDKSCLILTTTEIAVQLASSNSAFVVDNASTQRLGRALKKNGFIRCKKDGLQKYSVLLKKLTNHSEQGEG